MIRTSLSTGPRPAVRRAVLGAAVAVALLVAATIGGARPDAPSADGSLADVRIVGHAFAADIPPPPKPPEAPGAAPPPPPPAPADAGKAAQGDKDAGTTIRHRAEITIDEKGIRIDKPSTEGRRSRNITIRGDVDGDLGDLGPFPQPPKWVGPLAFITVTLMFLVPLAAVALVVWYKMRRTRMINETLLKYAEKGIAPPPEALHALGGSAAVTAMESMPSSAPMYEQARAMRKRVAWSDLRKGVVLGAIGLGLTLWSMLDDGSPNVGGLVLLFLGIGYGVLWYVEERQGRGAGTLPPGGA